MGQINKDIAIFGEQASDKAWKIYLEWLHKNTIIRNLNYELIWKHNHNKEI